MKAKEIMSAPAITAGPNETLKRIAERLLNWDISAVPIVDEDGTLLGIVSEADLVKLQSVEDPRRHLTSAHLGGLRVPNLASEVMSTGVATVEEDEDVTTVARRMLERGVRRIVVVSGSRVVGIISRRDVLKVLARTDASIEAELQEVLDEQAGLLGQYHAEVEDGVVTLTGPNEVSGQALASVLARAVPGVVAVRFAVTV